MGRPPLPQTNMDATRAVQSTLSFGKGARLACTRVCGEGTNTVDINDPA